MSQASEATAGIIIIADYVSVDAAGKVTIVGGAIQYLGFDPETGLSSPFALFVSLTANLPPAADRNAALEIMLVDLDGQAVQLPGPAGPQAMRIAQNITFNTASVAGVPTPPSGFPLTHNVALNFPNGLPLALGRTYEWVVQLDHELVTKATIYVPGPVPGPVIG